MKTCQEIIDELFKEQDWRIVVPSIDLQIVVDVLPFYSIMELSGRFYFKVSKYNTLKEYATILWFAIREKYPTEWAADWKNEAFLGISCQKNLWRCDLALDCYFRAYNSLKNPPHTLLLLLAGCDTAPIPPISIDERKKYAEKALEMALTFNTANQMYIIYRQISEKKGEKIWLKKAEELDQKRIYSPSIIPNAYKTMVNLEPGEILEE